MINGKIIILFKGNLIKVKMISLLRIKLILFGQRIFHYPGLNVEINTKLQAANYKQFPMTEILNCKPFDLQQRRFQFSNNFKTLSL